MAKSGERKAPPGSSARKPLFIVSSNVEKVDPTTRKLIRSHVMQGKKRKRGLRGAKQRPSTWDTTASHTIQAPVETCAPQLPAKVGSDMSFIQLADEIDPLMAIKIVKFSSFATSIIFPLRTAIGFRAEMPQPLGPITEDAAVLHITAFAVDGFIQRILRRQRDWLSPDAMLHLQTGLRILRKRLMVEDDAAILSNSTISAVVKLADTSHFVGDHRAARQHMKGLRKIVELRGGIEACGGTRSLAELMRCDLRIAILSNTGPVFYRQPSESIPDYPKELLPTSNDKLSTQETTELIRILDQDLATAWRVMKKFCLLVNLGTQTKRLIYPEYIHDTMISLTYRLLKMRFVADSINEAVRLGLIAFSHHVFLQWQDIKLPSYPFLSIYRDCVLDLDRVEEASSELKLWLLMIAVISLFEMSDEAWLIECLQAAVNSAQLKTWKDVNGILKSCMWISSLDDLQGMRNFDLLSHSRRETPELCQP